jgi:ATP-dependent Lon protease
VTKKKKNTKFSPTVRDLEEILGPKRFSSEIAQKPLKPGVVTGLAWTSFGGEILFIETLPLKGKGFKLTGQLGDVMNESANIAYSYVKKLLQEEISGSTLTKKKVAKKKKVTTVKKQEIAPREDYLKIMKCISTYQQGLHRKMGRVQGLPWP